MVGNNGKVWLVTGANSGFGRAITQAAVAAGDTVIGAVRRPQALDDLVAAHPDQVEAVALDITDAERIDAVAADVLARYGRVDVLVNNAGRTQVGAFEETTEQELRDLFELHVFGPARLTRALLPHMRERRSGAVVMMSSMGGQLSFAGFSAYSATKAALEQLAEGLADEVRPHGVTVLIAEPGAFRTNLFGQGAAYFSEESPAYAETAGATRKAVRDGGGAQPGDPAKAAAAIRLALEAEPTPLRLVLGGDAVDAITGHLDSVRAELREWEKVSRGTDLD
ncbi:MULTISPECIES: SDR family NAD(P)-dependent oxidoreductase [unclassified Streptomyces]|uniref:SDR family NAD(P)-dependent oxidoreductase n=1 Tax=Streptomyces TaxID=1883 RepID=UPI0001C1895E|nr:MULTISPECIES: SDR family NAD(P)-dependent oxidoreductase [unclassified Streptomyces]AEN11640.1 short-chain dehydrogenase/reductase SDR [Streptomyces sp. SirexAA-E]MYR66527.1 SDR family NAD(P)-dependent oxidoreductase [Streptomyces sp. SID4939]MYS04587.1 SDR family NAD(P)-dependent oxidoreductase [Streptomyces sp. SID4940]MYT61837.1 SDR family NAD(P)-dependent oxidoreductase [Streptomyces sp. SID8357]MYT85207.1 SDR family NAD(P)-dependent oxidoreductase [Streptomyces sp. SID8360]